MAQWTTRATKGSPLAAVAQVLWQVTMNHMRTIVPAPTTSAASIARQARRNAPSAPGDEPFPSRQMARWPKNILRRPAKLYPKSGFLAVLVEPGGDSFVALALGVRRDCPHQSARLLHSRSALNAPLFARLPEASQRTGRFAKRFNAPWLSAHNLTLQRKMSHLIWRKRRRNSPP